MKYIIATSFLFSFIYSGVSQNSMPLDTVKSVVEISFMEGNWKGEGWIVGRDRIKKHFAQTETIQFKVGQQVLMVEGLGYAKDNTGTITRRVIHDAFGIISYNEIQDAVTMISFSTQNGRMEVPMMRIGDKQLQWSFKNEQSGGLIRFTEDFSEVGKWKEVGEFSINGADWYPFFEMQLNKQ